MPTGEPLSLSKERTIPMDAFAIDRAPLDTMETIEERAFRIASRSGWIDSLIWDEESRTLWGAWLFLGQGQGGQEGLNAIWAELKTKTGSLNANILQRRTRWDSATQSYREQLASSWEYLTLDRMTVLNSGYVSQVKPLPQHLLWHLAIVPRASFAGPGPAQFPLLMPGEWSAEERLRYAYAQINSRLRLPLLPEWIAPLWQWLGEVRRLRPLASMGAYVGWQVTLDEEQIRGFLSRGIAARTLVSPLATEPVAPRAQSLEALERPPEAVPVAADGPPRASPASSLGEALRAMMEDAS